MDDLAALGESGLPIVIRELGNSSRPGDRFNALVVIGRISGDEALSELATQFVKRLALSDPDPFIRLTALSQHIYREKPKTFSVELSASVHSCLQEALSHPSPAVRLRAVHFMRYLAEINQRDHVREGLTFALSEETHPEIIIAIANLAWGESPDKRIAYRLFQWLSYPKRDEVVEECSDTLLHWLDGIPEYQSDAMSIRNLGVRSRREEFVRRYGSKLERLELPVWK